MQEKALTIVVLALLVPGCGDTASDFRVVGELTSIRIELTADVAEPIVEIRVAEGESVAAGTVLLRQNSARADTRLQAAAAVLAGAQAQLRELVSGPRAEQIVAARANLDGAVREQEFRTAELERATRVHAQQLASPESLNKAQVAFDTATAGLGVSRANLQELLAGTRVEQLAQAEQTVRQARANRDRAQVDVERHTIRAPVDGVADSRLFEIGERPLAGQPLIVFLSGAQVYARVYVPENLRVRITTGTKAKIYVDGLAEVLAGTVRWVSSEAAFTPYFALTERDRGRLSYVAKVDIDGSRERLPDGVPVEVEFLLDVSQ